LPRPARGRPEEDERQQATRPEPGRAEPLTAADPEQVRGALGQIDSGVAGHLLLGMQQGQGNAYVARMVAGSQQAGSRSRSTQASRPATRAAPRATSSPAR
jgi:hypothetical protein